MTSLRRPAARPAALLVLVLTLLGAVALLIAAPSSAHDVLTDAEPAEDAVLEEAPDAVVLRFSNEVLELNPAIIVSTAAGETVAEDVPELDGRSVRLDLPADLPGGDYRVQWSVVSSDGHRIQGDYGFSVDAPAEGDGGSAPPAAAEEPTEEATDTGSADGTTIGPAPQEPAADEPGGTGLADLPGWARVLAGIVAVGALAALVVLLLRRRGTGGGPD